MSKKQKRKVSQGTRQAAPTSIPFETPSDSPATPVQSPARTSPSASPVGSGPARTMGSRPGFGSRRFMPAPEFKPDYTYIKSDLKRIGILAGSFFAILIVLSFVLK